MDECGDRCWEEFVKCEDDRMRCGRGLMKCLQKCGREIRWPGQRPARRRYPEETRRKAVWMVQRGAQAGAVAREFGISPSTVLGWCRKAGVRPRSGTGRVLPEEVRSSRPRVLEAVRLAKEGLSNREIAERMGVSKFTVSRYLGIARRGTVREEDYPEDG